MTVINNKAIIVYVDDTERCLEEFTWLYKSWRMWKHDSEFDLVVYCNPTAVSKIPVHENLLIKPKEPLQKTDLFWKHYAFVNSFAMFNDISEAEWVQQRYSHVMKTDCDVFLTKHFSGHAPNRLMLGAGGYLTDSDNCEVINNLKRISETLNIKQNHMHNIGATIFGKTSEVVPAIRMQYTLTKYLLSTEWKTDIGTWPGWYRGVASMYAFELAINAIFSQQHVTLYALDEKCWKHNVIDKSTLHIHAWHSADYFSKHDWFKGKYQKLVNDNIPTNTAEYCHWIVSNDLETLINTIKKENISHEV
jgi:hypothetical protein